MQRHNKGTSVNNNMHTHLKRKISQIATNKIMNTSPKKRKNEYEQYHLTDI